MSPSALADTAASLGVRLSLDGDRLAYDAPDGDAEVDRLLALLAEHREAVVAHLQRRRLDAIARRLVGHGVAADEAERLSERVCIEIEPWHALLSEGARLLDARLLGDDE